MNLFDNSILNKIERNYRAELKEMLQFFYKAVQIFFKPIHIELIESPLLTEFGNLKFIIDGLKKVLKKI